MIKIEEAYKEELACVSRRKYLVKSV